MWTVELESGVWLAETEGDPGRTLRHEDAQQFGSMAEAAAALTAARKYRPFERACIGSAPSSREDQSE